jgi:hypothetical protein
MEHPDTRYAWFRRNAMGFGYLDIVVWFGGLVTGVAACRGQAGVLAMVMTAGAMRVAVSFAVAWPKLLGDFDLRARWRFRSTMVRHLAISLVRAC